MEARGMRSRDGPKSVKCISQHVIKVYMTKEVSVSQRAAIKSLIKQTPLRLQPPFCMTSRKGGATAGHAVP